MTDKNKLQIDPELLKSGDTKKDASDSGSGKLSAETPADNAKLKSFYALDKNQWHSLEGAFALVDKDRGEDLAFDSRGRAGAKQEEKVVERTLLAQNTAMNIVPPELEEASITILPEGKTKPPLMVPMGVREFIDRYDDPLPNSYHHSKSLSEGHPEKSPMLEDIVDRMLSVPWSNKIKLNYSEKLPYSYYDGAKSTINVVPSSDSTRMLQETANNAWYATHQFLDALYDRKLPQDDYVKTKVRIEVEALKAADAIRKEVTGDKGAPVKFQYRNEHGQVELLDVRDYLQNHSDKDLAEFIRKAGHTDQKHPSYGALHESGYKNYLHHFDANKSIIEQLLRRWVQNGGKRQEL